MLGNLLMAMGECYAAYTTGGHFQGGAMHDPGCFGCHHLRLRIFFRGDLNVRSAGIGNDQWRRSTSKSKDTICTRFAHGLAGVIPAFPAFLAVPLLASVIVIR
jgi:hypothetical protein